MKLGEIITYVDGVKPNAFSAEDKVLWLNELEYELQADVFGAVEDFTAHDWEDEEEEMLLPEAWHKLYYTYLEARILAAEGEWSEYQNAVQLYNAFRGEYERWYDRNFVDGV